MWWGAVATAVGCDGGGFCFPTTQEGLNEALPDDRCLTIRVLDFDAEFLDASSERDDIELSVNPGYCVEFNQCQGEGPILKTAHIDHIPVSAINLESVVVTRYQGGSVRAPSIDMTLDEPPTFGLSSAGFTVMDGGSVRLRATAPMEGWRRLDVGAQPSWEGVTVEIDLLAQPVNELGISGSGLNLAQLQQFGARAREISVALTADVADAYAAWLESEGFTGTLVVLIDGQSTEILPRPTTP